MFSRLELLWGKDTLNKLSRARILLLGVGGVGSWIAETLVRSGIGHLTIVDFDVVKKSNLNRQILAVHSTLEMKKVDAMRQRLMDINPGLSLSTLDIHLTPDNISDVIGRCDWDYVIDAIDERQAKSAALIYCVKNGLPVISSMGAARKTSSEGLAVVDISQTTGCPLARLVRKALHKEGIMKGVKVVFSPTSPDECSAVADVENPGERRPLGSVCYVPAMFGLRCAEEVLTDLIQSYSNL